jgi:diguanylate cyclase (GGDEF)-like protein
MIDLRDLRLDDALALLGHAQTLLVPATNAAPTGYLQSVIDGLCELSLKDPLTGLSNRRHLNAVLEREIEVVARSGNSCLLLMLDIDHFKKVNDTYGHVAGDQVLQAVARCLTGCIRPQDTLARFGGEEFAVLMPDCQFSYGEAVAERIRLSVASLSIPLSPLQQIQVTISIGGAFAPVWVRSTSDLWIERADTKLYLAKSSGRNQVRIDQPHVIYVSAEEKSLLFGSLNMDESKWIESSTDDSANSMPRTSQ